MEPSGRNQRQPVANPPCPKPAATSQKRLPRVATGCRSERMVRRGSTVRVRQRALQKPRKTGLFLSVALAQSPACGRYGALYGAFRSKTPRASQAGWRAARRVHEPGVRRYGFPSGRESCPAREADAVLCTCWRVLMVVVVSDTGCWWLPESRRTWSGTIAAATPAATATAR